MVWWKVSCFFFREHLVISLVFFWEVLEFFFHFVCHCCPLLSEGCLSKVCHLSSFPPKSPTMFPYLFWGDFDLSCPSDFSFFPIDLWVEFFQKGVSEYDVVSS